MGNFTSSAHSSGKRLRSPWSVLLRTAVAFAILASPLPASAALYSNGFEVDISDWNAFGGGFNATRVASGTNGITSASGSFHAESSASGSASRWGGYNYGAGNAVPTTFQSYRTSVDIYLNVSGGWANNTRFDFSSAINNSAGTHRRDFIFNGGFYNDTDGSPGSGTSRFVISASTNSQPGSAFAKNPARGPIAISTSGWYTFEHHFYDNAGVLAVEMNIYDSSNALVNSWTISDLTDLIAVIGGNRYGWFSYNQFSTLAFDNASLILDCTTDVECETDGLYCTYDTCDVGTGLCSSVARDCSTDILTGDFEFPPYSPGTINGQDGWSRTGPFDHNVDGSLGTTGFGAQSLRISNAVTSGSFGDQTFSFSLANEVGETTATNDGMSGGSRRTYFESEFEIVSATAGEQPGLFFSTSADRGDGARMTYLRFEDSPTGIQVYFDDYQDFAPFGTVGTPADGCDDVGDGDDFIETQVGTDLDRTIPHTIRETLDVLEGPRNDVVNVYIDNVLVHTGTSWEDYFRWCEATGVSRTVDSRLFRTSSTAAPATLGFGFLIDNFSLKSGTNEGEICGDTCNEATDSCNTASGTACTDDFNPCTIDQCDGAGTCTHTPGNAGSTCRASAGPCDLAETCTGLSATCPADTFVAAATPCRASAGVCDVVETCTGAAAACPADAKSVATCRASGGVCDIAEVCDGVSDVCGADVKSVAVCRGSGGSCDVVESCDGIADACPADGFIAAATPCRASGGVCDVAESCSGVAAACPTDAKSVAACRASAGICDVAETCDGVSNTCGADAKSVATCRASGGVCDIAEVCDGVSDSCGADAKSVATCRASAGICDAAETCDGVVNACPADGFVAAATPCRASGGVCDVAESCTGAAAACPADAKSVAVCRGSGGVCDVAETCDGLNNACPVDAFQASTVPCRGAGGVCDLAETCTGAGAACPADAKSVATCRGSAGVCDVAETCDGVANACPTDAFVAADTACTSDGNGCTNDVCDGSGTCTHAIAGVCLQLQPSYLYLRQQVDGNLRGRSSMRASFLNGAPSDPFNDSDPIVVTITDGLTLNITHTWMPSECAFRGPRLRCVSSDKNSKASFWPIESQPGAYRMRTRLRNLAVDGPFFAPFSVSMQHGASPTSHTGEIQDCLVTNNGARCKQP